MTKEKLYEDALVKITMLSGDDVEDLLLQAMQLACEAIESLTDGASTDIGKEEILKVIRSWKHHWFSKEPGYESTACNIDANMMHHLAKMLTAQLGVTPTPSPESLPGAPDVDELINLIKSIKHAYSESHGEYHNYEYWGDEQWSRINDAFDEAFAAVYALDQSHLRTESVSPELMKQHEKWCPHFHHEYQLLKERIQELEVINTRLHREAELSDDLREGWMEAKVRVQELEAENTNLKFVEKVLEDQRLHLFDEGAKVANECDELKTKRERLFHGLQRERDQAEGNFSELVDKYLALTDRYVEVHKDLDELKAKCARYEAALKVIGDVTSSRGDIGRTESYRDYELREMAREALDNK